MRTKQLTPEDTGEAITVLCEAFHDYPVMRYVLGPSSPETYDRRLRALIEFFATARTLREEPPLGVYDQAGALAGVALVSLPGGSQPPPALEVAREAVWQQLGHAERRRYEAYGEVTRAFDLEAPHCHLNMIGVRHSHLGRGVARHLLNAVHDLSREHPISTGVTLNTEAPRNLSLYRHFGYRLLGHATVGGELETWAFFRLNPEERS